MAKISDVEGIGPVYASKLGSAGITTMEKLLKLGADSRGRQEISNKCGISDNLVLEWVNRADLCRIKGVGSEYSDLLECSGVDTVPELAQRNARNLHAKMVDVNNQKKLVRKLPTESQIEDWISQARRLPRAVHY